MIHRILPLPLTSRAAAPRNGEIGQARNRKTGKSEAAFTLIELMIVVAILSILLTLLAGGIKKSVDNAKKRGRETETQALQSAIMTYWHDTGKFPITTSKGKYTYTFTEDNNAVFAKLIDESQNDLKKKYLDINQMRTKDNGRIRPMKRASEPLVDYKGDYYKVTIDLTTKTATVK